MEVTINYNSEAPQAVQSSSSKHFPNNNVNSNVNTADIISRNANTHKKNSQNFEAVLVPSIVNTKDGSTNSLTYISTNMNMAPIPLRENLISQHSFEKAITSINKELSIVSRRIEHSIHEDTNKVVIRVVNCDTDELVRELPPEERLDSLYRLRQSLGINVDSFI